MIKTKIVATLGPASSSPEKIAQLIEAGVDVFRLNFSHGTRDGHAATLAAVREQARRLDVAIAVLGDLGGPKIRLGEVASASMDLPPASHLVIQRQPIVGQAGRVSCSYPQLIDDVAVGQRVLLADGRLRLRVVEKRPDEVVLLVEVGGPVSSHKGINLPDTRISSPAITDKDHHDLVWAIEHRIDYLGLSFVQRADDVRRLKRELADHGGPDIPVISKIEKPQALEEIDAIIAAGDGIMVARGDLGVELELARVPLVQKDLTARCHRAGVPVIIATQMLSSMVDRPTATRAEISDVANAVFDRADATMLSEETAVGQFPVEAVRTMARVAELAERYLDARPPAQEPPTAAGMAATGARAASPADAESLADVPGELAMPSAVTAAADTIARSLPIRCVVVHTASGTTARLLSKKRLGAPALGLSPSEEAARRMALYYGVYPCQAPRASDDAAMIALTAEEVREHRLADPGDLVLIVSGANVSAPGQTNSLMIHRL